MGGGINTTKQSESEEEPETSELERNIILRDVVNAVGKEMFFTAVDTFAPGAGTALRLLDLTRTSIKIIDAYNTDTKQQRTKFLASQTGQEITKYALGKMLSYTIETSPGMAYVSENLANMILSNSEVQYFLSSNNIDSAIFSEFLVNEVRACLKGIGKGVASVATKKLIKVS